MPAEEPVVIGTSRMQVKGEVCVRHDMSRQICAQALIQTAMHPLPLASQSCRTKIKPD